MAYIKNRWIFISLFLLCAVFFSFYNMQNITDPDIPWHLATGKFIFIHHLIPHKDIFSWTAKGTPWITQEWFFEVLLYIFSHYGHFLGFFLFNLLLEMGTLYFLYRLSFSITKGKQIISMTIAFFGIWIAHPFWINRPQLMSYFMFALFLYIANQVRHQKYILLYLSPLFILIWSNSHASSLIGSCVFLFELILWIIPGFGNYQRNSLSKKQGVLLGAGFISSLLVGIITPDGIKTYAYVLLSTNPLMTNNIVEWKSPNFQTPYLQHVVLIFIILSLLIIGAKKEKKTFHGIVYFLGTMALFLIHQRFIPYMGIASVFGISESFSNFKSIDFSKRKWYPKLNLLYFTISLLSISWLVSIVPQLQGKVNRHFSKETYPIHAVSYMIDHHLTFNVLNDYAWGGYLIYRKIRPFIDGRTGIYLQNGLFGKYVELQQTGNNLTNILKTYHVDVVLFPDGSLVSQKMKMQKHWKEVYQDSVADVFKKN